MTKNRKTRQDKSSFRSLSDTYLPPQTRPFVVAGRRVGRGSIGLLSSNAPVRPAVDEHCASEHRAFSGQRRVSPEKKARQRQFIRRNAVFTGHIAMYRWRHFRQSRLCHHGLHKPLWQADITDGGPLGVSVTPDAVGMRSETTTHGRVWREMPSICLALPDIPASDLPVLIRSRWNASCQALCSAHPCQV